MVSSWITFAMPKSTKFQGTFDKQEICGFKIRMHHIMSMNRGNAFKHLFPIKLGGPRVKFGMFTVNTALKNCIEIDFSKFHQLCSVSTLRQNVLRTRGFTKLRVFLASFTSQSLS
jgi:hypothetical protein